MQKYINTFPTRHQPGFCGQRISTKQITFAILTSVLGVLEEYCISFLTGHITVFRDIQRSSFLLSTTQNFVRIQALDVGPLQKKNDVLNTAC